MKRFYLLPLFLLFVACGSLEKGSGSSVAFDLPPALQTETTADTKAFLLATNGEETKGDSPKELELTIADGKVSGTINLKPGLWTLELHFYQKAPSGSYLLVAMVSFGEKEVGEEGLELSYDPSQIFFDDFNGTSPSIASPSVSLPANCSKLFDCDGDGFSNFEEIKAGSNPEDAKSMPQKKSESTSAPVVTTTTNTQSSVTTPSPAPLTRVMDGLVGWWKFDDLPPDSSCNPGATGQITTIDSSTNGFTGSLKNTPCWVKGVSGSSLEFNIGGPVEDWVSLPASLSDKINGAVTLEAWFKTADVTSEMMILSIEGAYILIPNWNFSYPSYAAAFDGGSGDDTFTTTNLSNNQWHHFAATNDGNITKAYIDGVLLMKTAETLFNLASTNRTSAIGAQWDGNLDLFKGSIDEVAIYNRALTTAEVRNNCKLNDPTGSTCAADDVPDQVTPSSALTLPPTRAFISWRRGTIPSGKTFDHDQLCYATNGSDISGVDNCLNSTNRIVPYFPLESLTASNSGYRWKVRTCYTDQSCSAYSPVWSFSTDNSVVAWWKFDDAVGNPDGSSTTADSSGNNHTGTMQNMDVERVGDLLPTDWISSDGILGTALNFDGVDDYVEAPDQASLDLDTAVSITARVRPEVMIEGSERGILSKGQVGGGGDATYGMSMFANGELARMFFYIGAPFCAVTNTVVVANSWHFLAGSYTETTTQKICYMDGLTGTEPFTSPSLDPNNTPLRIGWDDANSVRFFPGLIDEVALYNRALPQEVLKNTHCATEALAGTNPLPEVCQ
ncbi:MAG: LamG domain-containing protein [Deltaproteobacteria bacterium]|nr:LamG domain-containing protein [Deltaproteobacteria bacterium]